GKPIADHPGGDSDDDQHGSARRVSLACVSARRAWASCTLFSALVIPKRVFLLHSSIVRALIEGVDVVTHNGVLQLLFLRTGELRRFSVFWRCCSARHCK